MLFELPLNYSDCASVVNSSMGSTQSCGLNVTMVPHNVGSCGMSVNFLSSHYVLLIPPFSRQPIKQLRIHSNKPTHIRIHKAKRREQINETA